MSTNYEPSAEAVEALAKELHDEMYQDCTYNEKGVLEERLNYAARFVLRRQHEREEPLLKELRDQLATWRQETPTRTKLERVLAAHAKLDAPKVPTLAALVKSADERAHSMRDKPGQMYAAVLLEDWLAVKAAVEREEKREKR